MHRLVREPLPIGYRYKPTHAAARIRLTHDKFVGGISVNDPGAITLVTWYSGNLRLRLPVSLHGRLAREAEREGVSLNQWIVSRLAG
jgi:hypothetical protein